MLVFLDPRDVDEKRYGRYVVQLKRGMMLVVGSPAAVFIRTQLYRDIDVRAERSSGKARSFQIEDSMSVRRAHSAGGAAGAYFWRKPFTAVQ